MLIASAYLFDWPARDGPPWAEIAVLTVLVAAANFVFGIVAQIAGVRWAEIGDELAELRRREAVERLRQQDEEREWDRAP